MNERLIIAALGFTSATLVAIFASVVCGVIIAIITGIVIDEHR